MFSYEVTCIKTAFRKTKAAVTGAFRYVRTQVYDPAVRRAVIVWGASIFTAKIPGLDHDTALQLSGMIVLAGLTVLSKLPGTRELARAKADAQAVAAPAPEAEVQV